MIERKTSRIPLRLRYACVLREWRIHNDLTQAAFAGQLGLRRQYLNTLENGANYSIKTLETILAAIQGRPGDVRLELLVAERIRKARKSKHLTQEDLAEQSKLSVLQVGKVERT